jgi:hypothetical protein
MTNFGRVGWLHYFPARFIAVEEGDPVRFPTVRRSVGHVHPVADPSTKYSFHESGFCSGDVVAFDLADGPAAKYAVNLRKALAVPAIAHLHVEGFKYVLYDADLAVKVAAALKMCNWPRNAGNWPQ